VAAAYPPIDEKFRHMTGALRTHLRQDRPRDIEKAEDICLEDGFDFGGIGLFDRTDDAESGVVDKDIDSPESLDRRAKRQ
jgi:hypothetical protein